MNNIDPRSASNIETLHPKVQPLAIALILTAAKEGITIKVISGTRTYSQQAELYAHGRSKPGPQVTKAPPGHSNHNFGLAFDIGVFEGARYIEEGSVYRTVGVIGKKLGLVWGGDWKSIQDEPHFELHPEWAAGMSESDMLTHLRARHEEGRDAFA